PRLRQAADLREEDDVFAPRREGPPDEPLAAPAAVSRRGVDEGAAERERLVDDLQRLLLARPAPGLLTELPRAEADLADLDSGPAEHTFFHRHLPRQREPRREV